MGFYTSLAGQRVSVVKYGSDPPDAGPLGGMLKLKPASPFINKVRVRVHKHNGTSQEKVNYK